MSMTILERFSVLITAYKNAELVKRCIDSLIESCGGTLPETVIVDDAAGDSATRDLVESYAKYRLGNLNATFIMRTPEVYLIAAEAALQLGDASTATSYVNKIRQRAGAQLLSSVDLRSIIDERGRELCGEYNRFFDLVRVGYLANASYLQETHPALAKDYKPEYVLKPIPQAYIDLIENGEDFVNPGY